MQFASRRPTECQVGQEQAVRCGSDPIESLADQAEHPHRAGGDVGDSDAAIVRNRHPVRTPAPAHLHRAADLGDTPAR